MKNGNESTCSPAIAVDYWNSCPAVERDGERLSGAWVFRGTRVPVIAFFENLMDGASVDDFLKWFPGVERWMLETVLKHETKALVVSRLS